MACTDTRRHLVVLVASSLTFLDSCSFESDDICGMLQSSSSTSDWQRVTKVPSGPSSDHTFLGKGTGNFMYFSTSTGNNGSPARLESRLFYPKRGYQCLEFFYHHSGSESDQLQIWIKEYTTLYPNGILKFVDSVSGKPADYWKLHFSSINTTNKFRFVFQGVKGGGNSAGGISIDDINLSENRCPQNVWHIRNFSLNFAKDLVMSPPYYSNDGYAYQIGLWSYATLYSPYNLAAYLYLITGENDRTLQWPCPWRQATVEFMDQNPNIQQRTSSMKSITTDPNQLSDANRLLWNNPALVGSLSAFPNGTRYRLTGGYGKFMFTAKEWLYRRDFLKGGDAFILISMEDNSQLTKIQPTPTPTPAPLNVPVLCRQNNCLNDGICVVENLQSVCRCKTSGDLWYVGDRCEKEVKNKGNVWTMSSLCALLPLFMVTLVNIV